MTDLNKTLEELGTEDAKRGYNDAILKLQEEIYKASHPGSFPPGGIDGPIMPPDPRLTMPHADLPGDEEDDYKSPNKILKIPSNIKKPLKKDGKNNGDPSDNQADDATQGNVNGDKGLPSDISKESENYNNGYADAYKEAMGKAPSKAGADSPEYRAGYEAAQRAMKKAEARAKGAYEVKGDKNSFSGDRISKEEMNEIAKKAGQGYSNEEAGDIDPEEKVKAYVKHNREQLHNVGHGSSLGGVLDKIDKLLAPKINWKAKLRKLFNDVNKSEIIFKRSKTLMAQDRVDRYSNVREINKKYISGIAQVFYFIDNSGSMGLFEDSPVLNYIMSEIINLSRSCGVQNSGATYFADNIDVRNIRLWKRSDSTQSVIKKLCRNRNDITGGTNISSGILSLMKLKGKYYDDTPGKETKIFVFTDAELSFGDLKLLYTALTPKQRSNIYFIVLNEKTYLDELTKAVVKFSHIPADHVIAIDRQEIERMV